MKAISLSIKKSPDFERYYYSEYRDEIKRTILRNLEQAKLSEHFQSRRGIFRESRYLQWFTLTGAMQITSLDVLGDAKSYFLTKKDRLLCKGNKYILRGPRYLAAINPSLSTPQKLDIYFEDLYEGIEYFKLLRNVSSDVQHKSLAPILDYVKNSIITLTNAFLHNEKRGSQDLEDTNYNELREAAVKAGYNATFSFYLSLLGELDCNNLSDDDLACIVNTATRVYDNLRQEYKEYILSSRDIVRPEASHPLTLLAFTAVLLERKTGVDMVIGMPSGGTEIAYLVSQAFAKKSGFKCNLV